MSCCTCARKTHLSPCLRPPTSRCPKLLDHHSTSISAATACTSCMTLTSTQTDQLPRPARRAQERGGGGGKDDDTEQPVARKRPSVSKLQTKPPCTLLQCNICRWTIATHSLTIHKLFLLDFNGLTYRLIMWNVK